MPRRVADGPTLLREACDMGEATFRQVAALEHADDDELAEPLASEWRGRSFGWLAGLLTDSLQGTAVCPC